jgi:hypothetical protein
MACSNLEDEASQGPGPSRRPAENPTIQFVARMKMKMNHDEYVAIFNAMQFNSIQFTT